MIFFAAKDGEALYSQQKEDRELTVAQIINYWQSQTEIEESREKPLDHSIQFSSVHLLSCAQLFVTP